MIEEEIERAPVGAIYLDDPTGEVYRLTDYGTDWRADPFTGDETIPSYQGMHSAGFFRTRTLPDSAREIWRPEP